VHFVSLLGLLALLAIAFLMSNNRRAINWRTVITGTLLQFVFALMILKTPWGKALFLWLNDAVTGFLDFSDQGARFVFGDDFAHHLFAFKVLPTIIFFSAMITVLYYLGVLQWIVNLMARLMVKTMGTSGSESLAAANSRIKDLDVAEETSRMSRSQILLQAGVSVLAQANQVPQLALKLLG